MHPAKKLEFSTALHDGNVSKLDEITKMEPAALTTILNDKGHLALHLAIYSNNIDSIMYCLTHAAETINEPDNVGATPLIYAVHQQNKATASLLLSHGANPNLPIQHTENTDNGKTALWLATETGLVDFIPLLLEYKASTAIQHESCHLIHLAVECRMGLVLDACIKENPAAIHHTIEPGLTPLILAAYCNHDEMLEKLIQHGGNANILLRSRDSQEKPITLLSYVTQQGYLESMKVLIESGLTSPSPTELVFIAIRLNHLDLVDYLIETDKALLFARNSDEATPLCFAARHGKTNIIHYLLRYHGLDEQYRPALNHAVQNHQYEAANALLSVLLRDKTNNPDELLLMVKTVDQALDLLYCHQDRIALFYSNPHISSLLPRGARYYFYNHDKPSRRGSFIFELDTAASTPTAHLFNPIKPLGMGAYGDVRLFSTKTDRHLAVKSSHINEVDEKNKAYFESKWKKEEQILQLMQEQPSPIKLFILKKDELNQVAIRLIMPYIKGLHPKRLFERLRCAKQFSRIVSNMVKELRTLHVKGILHGDIKSSNILINSEERVTFIDAGLSYFITDTPTRFMAVKNQQYPQVAPEFFKNEAGIPADPSQDIYAFGYLLFALVKLSPIQGIIERDYPSIVSFIEQALEENPTNRPSLDTFYQALLKDEAAQQHREKIARPHTSRANLAAAFFKPDSPKKRMGILHIDLDAPPSAEACLALKTGPREEIASSDSSLSSIQPTFFKPETPKKTVNAIYIDFNAAASPKACLALKMPPEEPSCLDVEDLGRIDFSL